MLNVAVLSSWHVHTREYGNFIRFKADDAQLTVLWDDDEERGSKMAEYFGIPYEKDLDTMLARADVDAVICCSPTTAHHDLLIKVAKAGKHIFTEKTLAPTMKECYEIADAIKESGIKFEISYPHLNSGAIAYAKKAIDDGLLGKVSYFRMRKAHDGASAGWLPAYWYDMSASGGGAMMDLGCHPNYIAAYLLGKPKRIASMFNNSMAPEGDDNAVSVIEFENGAIGVVETGFLTPISRSPIEIQGTEGTITISIDNKLTINSRKLPVRGDVLVEDLPKDLPHQIRQWIDAILYGKEIFMDLDKALALTELLENEYKSDAEGTIVKL